MRILKRKLNSAFGTPATVGEGFIGIVNDNNAGFYSYICWVAHGEWWYASGTKAI